MPVTGTPAFNAVAILRIEAIDFSSNDLNVAAQGAFVNVDTGMTYGKTTCRRWSQRTIDKLAELRALMEEDLALLVFTKPTPGVAAQQAEPGGIGEELRGPSDAQQV